MIQTYHIPDDATPATLTEIHNEVLAHNAGVRVHNRWGAFSEYSVKVKLRDVEELLGRVRSEKGDPDPAVSPWRFVFGWDDGPTVDAQYYDTDLSTWESALLGVDASEAAYNAVTSWLDAHHPAWRSLVEIDRRLLR